MVICQALLFKNRSVIGLLGVGDLRQAAGEPMMCKNTSSWSGRPSRLASSLGDRGGRVP